MLPTAFCTSTSAMSRSVSQSKMTVATRRPDRPTSETSRMPRTVSNWRSTRSPYRRSISAGGRLPARMDTTTVGLCRSGRRSTGSSRHDSQPTRATAKATTLTATGRRAASAAMDSKPVMVGGRTFWVERRDQSWGDAGGPPAVPGGANAMALLGSTTLRLHAPACRRSAFPGRALPPDRRAPSRRGSAPGRRRLGRGGRRGD